MPIEKTDYFQVTTKQKQSKLISIGDLTDSIVSEITSHVGTELKALRDEFASAKLEIGLLKDGLSPVNRIPEISNIEPEKTTGKKTGNKDK